MNIVHMRKLTNDASWGVTYSGFIYIGGTDSTWRFKYYDVSGWKDEPLTNFCPAL